MQHMELVELWERYRPFLSRVARERMHPRLVGRVDVTDILQDAFIDLRGARSVDDPGWTTAPTDLPPRVWFRLAVIQRLRMEFRRHLGASTRDARRETSLDEVSDRERRDAGLETPSRVLSRRETRQWVRALIERLEPLDREILELRDIHRVPNDECARRLGISKSAASNRYRRSKDRLRLMLDRCGISDAG
ncbi:MAG: sigma-70 family RNA polymerase sigma factor [Isosphaeraceae bacterium]|nr:sigma-70 family RNA polymerase sigma factor [Isosphaeraceae bacterium]